MKRFYRLARNWRSELETLSLLKGRAVEDRSEKVREVLVEALGFDWRNDDEIFALLNDIAVNDPMGNVRNKALEQLILHWPEEPGILLLLAERAERDKDIRVQRTVKQEMQRRFGSDVSKPGRLHSQSAEQTT